MRTPCRLIRFAIAFRPSIGRPRAGRRHRIAYRDHGAACRHGDAACGPSRRQPRAVGPAATNRGRRPLGTVARCRTSCSCLLPQCTGTRVGRPPAPALPPTARSSMSSKSAPGSGSSGTGISARSHIATRPSRLSLPNRCQRASIWCKRDAMCFCAASPLTTSWVGFSRSIPASDQWSSPYDERRIPVPGLMRSSRQAPEQRCVVRAACGALLYPTAGCRSARSACRLRSTSDPRYGKPAN